MQLGRTHEHAHTPESAQSPPGFALTRLAIGSRSANCSGVDSLPTLAFTLAGKDMSLEPSFYVLKVKDEVSGQPECQLGMQVRALRP